MIASRLLKLRTQDGDVDLPVRVHAPRESEGAWACRTEIGWPEGTQAVDAYGHDAIQAFYLALQIVGIHLYTSDYHADGDIFFPGQGKGYGFPLPPSLRGMLIGDDATYF
ncbi:DUF6968 family protein [Azorhizobium doebereinerae]|uniref:DUF6968 family protein n=1 Tax=Azorhizobium doebereinerae TaxID=281091 RepID=UPI000401F0D3|nr:hypothetical protein [Azorhizobium doebereinerae]